MSEIAIDPIRINYLLFESPQSNNGVYQNTAQSGLILPLSDEPIKKISSLEQYEKLSFLKEQVAPWTSSFNTALYPILGALSPGVAALTQIFANIASAIAVAWNGWSTLKWSGLYAALADIAKQTILILFANKYIPISTERMAGISMFMSNKWSKTAFGLLCVSLLAAVNNWLSKQIIPFFGKLFNH